MLVKMYTSKTCGKRHIFCKECRPDIGVKIGRGLTGHVVSLETRARIGNTRKNQGLSQGRNNSFWNSEGFSINRQRVFVRVVSGWERRARVVWVQYNGPIPKGYLVHHRDENTLNDEIDNLRCWPISYHTRHHNLKEAV